LFVAAHNGAWKLKQLLVLETQDDVFSSWKDLKKVEDVRKLEKLAMHEYLYQPRIYQSIMNE
jgi:hypothetical protein